MRHLPVLLAIGLPLVAAAAGREATNAPPPSIAARPFLRRLAWYVPNRLFDLADIVRVRVRAGPGLAVHARATKWAVLYAGEYNAVYAGLPGPRLGPTPPALAGYEQEKGLALLAVDATDTLPHEPRYAKSEFILGAQALVVGAEAGFDPVELVDFVLGFVGVDIRRDDH